MKIHPNDWNPVGINTLEPAALDSVRINSNVLITAGPGAGKTELLAQKACFLLQTHTCKPPKRILAISFKKDSAANLKDRVEKRLEDKNIRFDSLTFDSFAKSILDRFREALPINFRPSKNYEIGFPTEAELYTFLGNLNYQNRDDVQQLIQIINSNGWPRRNYIDKFTKEHFTNYSLNDPNRNREHILNWAADLLWARLIEGHAGKSTLSFHMISRLAELIIRTNPYIKKSIQATYSYVFLDEFQDTTNIQYEFIKACFMDSQASLTAVGDQKQRIMRWAGALENVFDKFLIDFDGETKSLTMNFRCAPKIINLQTLIARHLDPNSIPQTPFITEGGIIKNIDFNNEQQEAEELSLKVKNLIEVDRVPAEEICFLVKQRTNDNTSSIIASLQRQNIKARVEDEFQDLLKEDIIKILISFLEYLFELSFEARSSVLKVLINENESLSEIRRAETKMRLFKTRVSNLENLDFSNLEVFKNFLDEIFGFVGINRLSSIITNYNQENVNLILDRFISKFVEIYRLNPQINLAVDEFLGKGVVRCMTIHKSKGLEYEVVFMIGIEDRMFWNFVNQPIDDLQVFFVGVSRAKSQLYLTFCGLRNGVAQSKNPIRLLYDFLRDAGSVFINRR